jgi:alpha-ketoglutarate-dependent taurine dioxygenase
MKTSYITNDHGDILGVQIHSDDVTNDDPIAVSKLIAEHGLVIYKRTKTPIPAYHDWQMALGYHQPANIWCNDPEYPIFFLVTNRQITEQEEGLFGHGELDWHCNILFTPDGEEIVGLYGKVCQPGANTVLANSIPMWKNLSQDKKDRYQDLWLKITNKIQETYEKKLAHYVLPTAEQKDFDKKRAHLSVTKAVNFNATNADLYPDARFLKDNFLRFKPQHPLGTDGLYFPHLNLQFMTDGNRHQLADHLEVYQEIKDNYIDSGRYVYSHDWEPGDVFLMDQLTTIHKRAKMDAKIPRELLRTACWYRTELRTHFKHSI